MSKPTLSPVQFHGSTIFVVTHKGEPYAPMRPIIEGMGLRWAAQTVKLNSNRERWGVSMIETPTTSGIQDTLCMPVRKLPAFFASINPNKVRSELRDRIRLYQDECDDALWNYDARNYNTYLLRSAGNVRIPLIGSSIAFFLSRCLMKPLCSNWRKTSAAPNRPTAACTRI